MELYNISIFVPYYMVPRLMHVVACSRTFFILRLNNFPLCVYITFLFMHSSVHGQLDCCHLASVCSGVRIITINTDTCLSPRSQVFFHVYVS